METQPCLERRHAAVRPDWSPDSGATTGVLDATPPARDEARERRQKVEELLGKLKIEDARNSGGQ